MKGKVFIGWSGDKCIADRVKERIYAEGYTSIVGGRDCNQHSESMYVGETIINQMQLSDQAIMIFKRKLNGDLSLNLLFELGYVLGRIHPSKIHIYYLGIKGSDSDIPTDIKGVWAEHIDIKSFTNNQIGDLIAENFLKNQKSCILENKMEIVNCWYKVKQKIDTHIFKPQCSDFELAQYVLFYLQAAYIFELADSVKKSLLTLKNSNNSSKELTHAINIALTSLDMFIMAKSVDDKVFIDEDIFLDIYLSYKKCLEENAELDDTEFKKWAQAFINEYIGYVLMLYATFLEINNKDYEHIYMDSIRYSEEMITLCDELSKESPNTNKEFASLFKAYAYRNIAISYEKLGDVEKENSCRQKSLEERAFLYNYYKNLNIDNRLFSNIEMEYFLMLAESIKLTKDSLIKTINVKKLKNYIDSQKQIHKSKEVYLNKISVSIKDIAE